MSITPENPDIPEVAEVTEAVEAVEQVDATAEFSPGEISGIQRVVAVSEAPQPFDHESGGGSF